jgi:two-component system, NtrC family, sensor kinase
MKKANIPANERERLKALLEYEILDTVPESSFDDFTILASSICGTPIALISLIDEDRQWFKSKVGLDAPETPRDVSFCGHAIHGRDIFVIEDSRLDERFADNPLVTGFPEVRFYAGAPLVTPDGFAIGTLCVIDHQARKITPQQTKALESLARQVIIHLELKKNLKKNQALFSEMKQLSQTIEEQNQKLMEAGKLVAIGEMASGIAHEINNPLAIIQGRTDILIDQIEQGDSKEELLKGLGKIHRNIERISHIIEGLRMFTRSGESGTFEDLNIEDVIEETMMFCFEKFRNHGIEITKKSSSTARVSGCRADLSRVFLNLLNNSFHAIHKQEERWIRFELARTNDQLQISVTDSGKGIAEQIADKVMQPFFTTKPLGEGVGLGLSIAAAIIKDHGGSIKLDRASDRTRFILNLPCA